VRMPLPVWDVKGHVCSVASGSVYFGVAAGAGDVGRGGDGRWSVGVVLTFQILVKCMHYVAYVSVQCRLL